MAAEESYISRAYLQAKEIWKGTSVSRLRNKKPKSGSTAFSAGRDPHSLADLLAITSDDMGWSGEIEKAQLIADWATFVGETTASHTNVIELRDEVLVVQCDSTAWATELRRLRAEILTRISQRYPDAGVTELKFLAPGAPTWRYGTRVVAGRGPRDTYG